MRHLAWTFSALFLFACATSSTDTRGAAPAVPSNPANVETPDEVVQATISTQDGTSFEHAIVIDAADTREGGTLEYRFIEAHFPGYRLQKQQQVKHEGRPYDVLHVTDASGEEHVVYFEISSYFGKR